MNVERTDNFVASLGHEAYRVGGSVRDELLGRTVKDADYMVRGVDLDGLLVALHKAAPRGKVTPLRLRQGGQFGWRISDRGIGSVEIALPRAERAVLLTPEQKLAGVSAWRAMEVFVDGQMSVADDAVRRDFTFNALYKRVDSAWKSSQAMPDGTLVFNVLDPTERGLYDLSHKLVRTTHEASFRDDPLRTMRALRFVSVLGYDLTADTREQMTAHADAVDGLTESGHTSGTVFDELSKILMGRDAVKALRLARDTGVLAVLLPELAAMIGFDQGSRYHDMTTDEHTFKALETAVHVDAPLRVRMALLFHDSGKPESAWVGKDERKHYYAKDGTEDHEVVGERLWRQAAGRMNVPRALREDVARLVRHHMVPVKTKNVGTRVRRMRVQFGDELLRDLLLHRSCDVTGKGKIDRNQLTHFAKMEATRAAAASDGVPKTVKDLAIRGRDLQELGIEGRRIGEILSRLLDEVVCEPEKRRDRAWQLGRAASLAGVVR